MTPNTIDTLDASTLLASSVLRLEIVRFLPRFPSLLSEKEKLIQRLIVGAHVEGLDADRPLCTNRIRLGVGLRQLEMCIPFRGKKGGEEQTVSYQIG